MLQYPSNISDMGTTFLQVYDVCGLRMVRAWSLHWKNKSVIRCDVGNPNSRFVLCFIMDFITQLYRELVVQLFDLTILF